MLEYDAYSENKVIRPLMLPNLLSYHLNLLLDLACISLITASDLVCILLCGFCLEHLECKGLKCR